jgi:solute carrier family 25 oxoglutarate transporter 11
LIGNPADLCLVRFQADGSLPVDQRRNYKNVFDAMGRIVKEEGLLTLWRGSGSTIARAMSMNLGMLAPFEEAKDRINAYTGTKDTVSTRLM